MYTEYCPVCNSNDIRLFKEVGKFPYYECTFCNVLFISGHVLSEMDAGKGLINYSESYWKEELSAARQRSWGPSLARVAETFLYARISIQKFVDIGSGPGYLLDALQYQLPSSSHIFYANELFPPAAEYCTGNKNYLRGTLLDFGTSFDAGCCIEVIEHLTPTMVKKLFADLAARSKENSIYMFNTGLSEFVKNENIGYLDPFVRGHVISWSIKGLQSLVGFMGFQILAIPGKAWAFIAEYKPNHNFSGNIQDRIWKAVPENINTLRDKKTGDIMYVLGLDTARAYGR